MKEIFMQYDHAINTHDFEEVARLLHEKAVFSFNGQTFANREQLKMYHDNFWNSVKESKFWHTDVNWIQVDSNTMVSTSTYNYTGYVDGNFTEGKGTSTDVFVKNKLTDEWLLIHEHSSK